MEQHTDGNFPSLTDKHVLLLYAYKRERNKSQAQQAIYHYTGRELNFGRHILPITQELIDLDYIKRTNPNASSKRGHNHIITPKGEKAVSQYLETLESISKAQPKFGF